MLVEEIISVVVLVEKLVSVVGLVEELMERVIETVVKNSSAGSVTMI